GAWVLQHQFRTGVSAVICRNPGRSIQMCSRICGAIITSGALTSRNEEHIRKEWDCVKKTAGSTDRLGGEKTSTRWEVGETTSENSAIAKNKHGGRRPGGGGKPLNLGLNLVRGLKTIDGFPFQKVRGCRPGRSFPKMGAPPIG